MIITFRRPKQGEAKLKLANSLLDFRGKLQDVSTERQKMFIYTYARLGISIMAQTYY